MKPLIYLCLTHILENRQKLVSASIPGKIIEIYIKKIPRNKVLALNFNLPAASGIKSDIWQTFSYGRAHLRDLPRWFSIILMPLLYFMISKMTTNCDNKNGDFFRKQTVTTSRCSFRFWSERLKLIRENFIIYNFRFYNFARWWYRYFGVPFRPTR